ncbi:hypothetical protein ACTFIV_008934 [Dictyostelium citrinum]
MSDIIHSAITYIKKYFVHLSGTGKKLQDLLFIDNCNFRYFTLLDIVNCFIVFTIIKIAIISFTLSGLLLFFVYSIFYLFLIILLLILLLFKIKFIFQSLNKNVINNTPSFTVGPYHSSVSASLINKVSSYSQSISNNGEFYFSFLEDGTYDSEFYIQNGHSTQLLLKKIVIEKQGNKFTPDFIDLSSSIVDISFRAFNKPVANSKVNGTIEFLKDGNKISISSSTDENGTYSTLLPECKLSIGVDGTVDGKPVKINEVYDIQKSEPIQTLQDLKDVTPKSFEKSENCSDYNIKSNFKKSVMLQDVSNSMYGYPMEISKTNCKNFIANTNLFAIGAWSDSIRFYSDSWESSSNLSNANAWIEGLVTGGGTDIKQAIEKAISKFHDADEFWILCDGDTGKFPDIQSWSNFYSNNSKYIINFVGIGSQSDERMKTMAQISRGKFIKVN